MDITASGVVLAHQDAGNLQSLCFPRIAILPGGRWLVGLRGSPAKQNEVGQRSLIMWSDDQGKSWSKPIDPFVAPKLEGRAGTFRTACVSALPDGKVGAALLWQDVSRPELPLFNPKTEGNLDMRLYFSISSDRGQTWSAPTRISERPHDNVPVALTGPILVMPDGRWAASFELSKSYDDPTPWRHAAVMTFSKDGGKTWGDVATVAQDPNRAQFYWDQRPQVMRDGSVASLLWTWNNAAGKYDNIHATVSRDGGRTWAKPWDTGAQQQPAPPVSLSNNRIAMVYVDRAAEPVIKLRVSTDGAKTFPASSELLVHKQPRLKSQNVSKSSGDSVDAWMEMEKFSLGLPDATALSENEVLTVFYAGPDSDHTDIRWARIRV